MFSHISYCICMASGKRIVNIHEVPPAFPFFLLLSDTISPVCISLLIDKGRASQSPEAGLISPLGLSNPRRLHGDRYIVQSCSNNTAPTSCGNQITCHQWTLERVYVCGSLYVCVCMRSIAMSLVWEWRRS